MGFDLLDVRRVERILVLALEREHLPTPPVEDRLRQLPTATPPASRFARPGSAFAHAHHVPDVLAAGDQNAERQP
ncbi:MAG: hypothetical protein HY332_18370 [Chloroflexi bacterium]|nr:hypothetical protein [Chloroflexota bacterium]